MAEGELVPQPHGGALKVGGTNPGAGKPRNIFRQKLLGAAAKNSDYWLKVAAGNKCILVESLIPGKRPGLRYPTHPEREAAWEKLLRYGLGTKDEVVVLGNNEVIATLAELLPDHLSDPALIDAILVDLGNRLNGDSQ